MSFISHNCQNLCPKCVIICPTRDHSKTGQVFEYQTLQFQCSGHHFNRGPFTNWTCLDHLHTRLVLYSRDPKSDHLKSGCFWCPVFEWFFFLNHSKSERHSKSGHVQISDPLCFCIRSALYTRRVWIFLYTYHTIEMLGLMAIQYLVDKYYSPSYTIIQCK